MVLNALNQNFMSSKFGSFISANKDSKQNYTNGNSYYAKKGEPMYREEMDSDKDGVVTFEDFKEYCKTNNISAKDMADLIDMRIAYRMTQEHGSSAETDSAKESVSDSFDLIYAKKGQGNYDSDIDINNDSQISYSEYLRYCEENARQESRKSDTKVVEDSKNKFMTVSFGHISNAYNKAAAAMPKGKIESKV